MNRGKIKILVVGAGGEFAGLVVPALAARGADVRGLIRDGNDEAAVRHHGATEVVVGDLTDSLSVRRALAGVDAVFYIAPAFLPDEAEVGERFVVEACRAGVRRFVFSSVIHPVLGRLVNHAAKAAVEEAVLATDLEYVFLHPALYFQNYARAWPQVAGSGVLAEPWSAATRFARVDYRDVAEVDAAAITDDRLVYGTYELCADGLVSRTDAARLAGEVLGREVRAERTDPAEVADTPAPLRAMFAHYEHHGLPGNPLTLHAILGREPRTLREYFRELAGQPTPGATHA